MSFSVFTRTWWKYNKDWAGGREPCAGRKTYLDSGLTEAEARARCKKYNESHDPGPLSRKAEYEEN